MGVSDEVGVMVGDEVREGVSVMVGLDVGVGGTEVKLGVSEGVKVDVGGTTLCAMGRPRANTTIEAMNNPILVSTNRQPRRRVCRRN
jgi:hypothetical protein